MQTFSASLISRLLGKLSNFYRGYDCSRTVVEDDPGLLEVTKSWTRASNTLLAHETTIANQQLSKYNSQVATLCETGIYDSVVRTMGDEWTMIYSGLSDQNKTRTAHGVTICLNRTAATTWKSSGSEWEPVSQREFSESG